MEICQHYDSNSIYILDYADCFRGSVHADYNRAHVRYEKNVLEHRVTRTRTYTNTVERKKRQSCNIVVDIFIIDTDRLRYAEAGYLSDETSVLRILV